MKGGVRKRGTTWSYYFDLGKVDGKRKKKEKGGFRTRKDAEAALIAALNEYNISQNPMKSVKTPKVERTPRERIILTLDEWNAIIDRFQDTRYYIPLMIGFYTGLRISEAFALTWDDIDLKNKTLSVNKQIVKRNFGADVRKVVEKQRKREQRSSWYFATPKTQTSTRTIPFGDTLYSALKQERARQLENERKLCTQY